MATFGGFGKLDLSSVDPDDGFRNLEPGEYVVKCSEAKVDQIEGTRNHKLVADFQDVEGQGGVRANFNVAHENQKAQEIALRQLKSWLLASGHPNPNKPGDVKTLKGLTCKVVVGKGKPWTDREGNQRQSTEIKKFLTTDGRSPSEVEAGGKTGGKSPETVDDDTIPF